MGSLQKQLVKKRAQRDALTQRKSELTGATEEAKQRQAEAEARLAEAAKLRREVSVPLGSWRRPAPAARTRVPQAAFCPVLLLAG